jgi:hypothetical protein
MIYAKLIYNASSVVYSPAEFNGVYTLPIVNCWSLIGHIQISKLIIYTILLGAKILKFPPKLKSYTRVKNNIQSKCSFRHAISLNTSFTRKSLWKFFHWCALYSQKCYWTLFTPYALQDHSL